MNSFPFTALVAAAISMSLGVADAAAAVAPLAYWRHEEGPADGLIPAGPDTVLDASGNGNHMQTFDPTFTSATYAAQVSPLPLRSGLANTLSLNFGPGGDDAGQNDDNYTADKPIQAALLPAMTVELAFKMNRVGGWQALLGKDGKPLAGSPVPPLKFLVRDDRFPNDIPNQLFIEWIDGDGDIHFLASGASVTSDRWNHVAFVLSATAAELWIAGEAGPYERVAELVAQDFAGPAGEVLIADPTSFTVGRGMFNGGVADWADALIDEVRISDAALTPDEFLFQAVPEAGSLALAACGAALTLARRRLRA